MEATVITIRTMGVAADEAAAAGDVERLGDALIELEREEPIAELIGLRRARLGRPPCGDARDQPTTSGGTADRSFLAACALAIGRDSAT